MNKLIIALIAGVFAATAGAQATPDAKKEKQMQVQETTKTGGDNTATGAKAAEGAAQAKASKNTPKSLPTKADKSAAAAEVSKTHTEGAMTSGEAAAKGSAMAKTQKNDPKALQTKKEKQDAVNAATKGKGG